MSIRERAESTGAFFRGFSAEGGSLLAASLAYYALFSVAPMLILAATLAQWVLGESYQSADAAEILAAVLTAPMVELVVDFMEDFQATRHATTYGIIAAGALVWAVGLGLRKLQAAVNHMWRVRVRPDIAVGTRVKATGVKYLVVLLPAAILVFYAALSSLLARLGAYSEVSEWLLRLLSSPVGGTAAVWIAVLIIYRYLPDAVVTYRDVLVPATGVAVAWVAGTQLFGLYLSTVGSSSLAGAASAVFVFLAWMHASAYALLLGAAKCRERAGGTDIKPQPHAYVVLPADLTFSRATIRESQKR